MKDTIYVTAGQKKYLDNSLNEVVELLFRALQKLKALQYSETQHFQDKVAELVNDLQDTTVIENEEEGESYADMAYSATPVTL